MLTPSDAILIKRSPGKGRGVFARRAIKKGEIIERAPILVLPAKALVDGLENEALGNYYFYWDKKTIVLALGYGSLYNHSFRPNAKFNLGSQTITYRAVRDIAEGDEICIHYQYDEKDMQKYNFRE